MREGILNVEVLFGRSTERESARQEQVNVKQAAGWNPEHFAREQIRSLVQHVFLSNGERRVRQVIFSALEPETDVRSVCQQVGDVLALETEANIAVVLQGAEASRAEGADRVAGDGSAGLRQDACRLRSNLWQVPAVGTDRDRGTSALLHSHLGGIRREFEYSIVEGPAAGESNEATVMAQFADGIILVLSAHRTRRAMARKIKETLEAAQVRILGTVLSDRVFPIPERIYRRL
jgi:hypothetical protein